MSQQKICRDKHVFSATKHVFFRDNTMLTATKPSSRPDYVCRNKIFLSRQKYKYLTRLSRQKFCCDKGGVLSWQFSPIILSKVLSRQKRCFVVAVLANNTIKGSVATNTCLPRQNTSFATKIQIFVQTHVCRDKTFHSIIGENCHDKQVFVATRQKGVCRDTTKRCLSRQK